MNDGTPLSRFIKYGYDSYVFVDDTRGTSDSGYKAWMRDGGGYGYGNTHQEAVASLINHLRAEADLIEKAAAEHFSK
jgi:hypothetical protein